MKSSTPSKGGSGTPKNKRSSKEREKRKSLGIAIEVNNHTPPEKGSPVKETNSRVYAGIDSEIILNYAEQNGIEHLPTEVTNILTEDINYRIRYVVNDSILKARLSGRNAITSSDLEDTFENLRIGRIYGASGNPNWVEFGEPGLFVLEDNIVNLIEIAEEENEFYQHSEAKITTMWVPDQDITKTLKKYFSMMCQMIISDDIEVRRMALINISENCRIGSITEWFYNFGYILLSKDITYDCLTLRALDLITVLENSPICRINVSERLLKLLVRLMLQRILKLGNDLLKPLCTTLAVLCIREPLRQFVVMKLLQKMDEIFPSCALPINTIANSLGTEAILTLILPNICLFLHKSQKLSLTSSILESYYILSKGGFITSSLYELFSEVFGDAVVMFNEPVKPQSGTAKKDINVTHVKSDLLRTRREVTFERKSKNLDIKQVFDMPAEGSPLARKIPQILETRSTIQNPKVVIGKTSLLLPVFCNKQKSRPKCHTHLLLQYNL